MSSDIEIKCRLDKLMDSRNITSEKLAMASGVPEMRINQYRIPSTRNLCARDASRDWL